MARYEYQPYGDEPYEYFNDNNRSSLSSKNRRKKKSRFVKKMASLVLSGAIFGIAAAGTFHGADRLLTLTDPANIEAAMTNLSSASSSSDSSSKNLSSPVLLTDTASGQGINLNVTQVAAAGLPSIVSITNISVQEVQDYYGMFSRYGRWSTPVEETVSCGSGIIIQATDSYLYIVTNYHVVENPTTLSVSFVDNQTYEAQLCGADEANDLAVIRVPMSSISSDTLSRITVASIGDSNALVVGEQVVAIGNALGYGQSVTTGIVSALDRTIDSSSSSQTTYIQTDAAINPGNSGGALLNMNGQVVGINTAKLSSTEVEGMGYAIPISQVLSIIQSLIV